MIIKRTSITRGLKLFIYNLISFIFQFGFSEENGCSAWLVLLTVIWIFYFVYIFLTYPTHCKKKNSNLKIFARSNFPEFWQNFILGKNIHFEVDSRILISRNENFQRLWYVRYLSICTKWIEKKVPFCLERKTWQSK